MSPRTNRICRFGFSIDEKYIDQLAILANSILKFMVDEKVSFHIIMDRISDELIGKMEALRRSYAFDFDVRECRKTPYSKLKIQENRWNVINFYRLEMHQVFPELEKALYLDIDLLVRDSLKELYEEDLGKLLAGVVEIPGRPPAEVRRILGISPNTPFFNSGVMLMNLAKWREEAIHEEFEAFLRKIGTTPPGLDQGLLNGTLTGRVKFLDPKYNVIRFMYEDAALDKIYSHRSKAEYTSSRENPVIYHFVGPRKPWLANSERYAFEYLKAAEDCAEKLLEGNCFFRSQFAEVQKRHASSGLM